MGFREVLMILTCSHHGWIKLKWKSSLLPGPSVQSRLIHACLVPTCITSPKIRNHKKVKAGNHDVTILHHGTTSWCTNFYSRWVLRLHVRLHKTLVHLRGATKNLFFSPAIFYVKIPTEFLKHFPGAFLIYFWVYWPF